MNDKTLPTRIRAADAADATRWNLPDITDMPDGREQVLALARLRDEKPEPEVEVVEDEIVAEKLTLEQWEKMCEEARQEGLEQGLEEGRKRGYDEGLAKGTEEGLKAGQASIEAQVERLSQIFDSLSRPLQQQNEALEGMLVKLVTQLAHAVVRAELTDRTDLLTHTIDDALALIPAYDGQIQLRLNPGDQVALAEIAEQQNWKLIADDSVTAGGCLLQAGSCRVDASVETRFAQIADQLMARMLPRTNDETDSTEADGTGSADE